MNPIRTLLMSALLLSAAGSVHAASFHADLYGGVFQGSDDTEPVDQRKEVGLMGDLTLDILPFGFCANAYYNWDDVESSGGLSEVETVEIQLGIYKQFNVPVVQPFIGGGVAWLNSSFEAAGDNTDEATIGAWAYVGARMTVLLIDFGVALGYTYAEVEVGGEDVDIGGFRAGVFAGIGF